MLECLNDLVGYVPVSCSCLDTVPDGFGSVTTSEINKYLTDLLPTDFISKKCGDSTIWPTLQRNRESSKQDLLIQITTQLKRQGKTFQPWSGYSCRTDGDLASVSKVYNGIRYTVPRNYMGVYATIREIMVCSGTAGDKTLKVFDRDGVQIGDDLTITIDAGDVGKWKVKELSTSIELPLWSTNHEEAHYNIVWNAENVRMNTKECPTCAGIPKYWKYMEPKGISSDSPGDSDSFDSANSTFGLRPSITIECHFENLICDARGDARSAAGICLHYAWAINCLEYAINSGEINTWTAFGGEYIEGLLNNHTSRLKENLAYLCELINTGDCVVCNPAIQKGSIFL